jgi:hypothetical protein
VTNYVVDELEGDGRLVFVCEEINRYLAGGDYVIGVWLSKPRVEYLVKVDEAAMMRIPPHDAFSSGVYFEAHRHGIVPLPFRFSSASGEGSA